MPQNSGLAKQSMLSKIPSFQQISFLCQTNFKKVTRLSQICGKSSHLQFWDIIRHKAAVSVCPTKLLASNSFCKQFTSTLEKAFHQTVTLHSPKTSATQITFHLSQQPTLAFTSSPRCATSLAISTLSNDLLSFHTATPFFQPVYKTTCQFNVHSHHFYTTTMIQHISTQKSICHYFHDAGSA